jgi:hypothetical protein
VIERYRSGRMRANGMNKSSSDKKILITMHYWSLFDCIWWWETYQHTRQTCALCTAKVPVCCQNTLVLTSLGSCWCRYSQPETLSGERCAIQVASFSPTCCQPEQFAGNAKIYCAHSQRLSKPARSHKQ